MRALALAAVLSLPAAAQTIYSWEDADGVHYTDDLSQVPKQAKVEATLLKETPRTATQKSPPLVSPPTRPARAEPNEREWRERFITATRRINTLEQSIAALEKSLPPRTECVPQPLVPVGTVQVGATPGAPVTTTPGAQVVTANGVTTVTGGAVVSPAARCQLNPQHDRVVRELELKRVELRDAKLDLEQLDRQASYDGVPREWRRGW